MAITVDYTPVAGLLGAAKQAGRAAGSNRGSSGGGGASAIQVSGIEAAVSQSNAEMQHNAEMARIQSENAQANAQRAFQAAQQSRSFDFQAKEGQAERDTRETIAGMPARESLGANDSLALKKTDSDRKRLDSSEKSYNNALMDLGRQRKALDAQFLDPKDPRYGVLDDQANKLRAAIVAVQAQRDALGKPQPDALSVAPNTPAASPDEQRAAAVPQQQIKQVMPPAEGENVKRLMAGLPMPPHPGAHIDVGKAKRLVDIIAAITGGAPEDPAVIEMARKQALKNGWSF